MQAKLSVSLLRYIGTIPADKAFYEAGMACKQVVFSGASEAHQRPLNTRQLVEKSHYCTFP